MFRDAGDPGSPTHRTDPARRFRARLSEWTSGSCGRDADRRLTPEGRERAGRVGRALAILAPEIRVVLTSPYRRARETAEPFAAALGARLAVRETPALEPGRDPSDILAELEAEGEESVLLVGHEPHLGELLGRLLFGAKGRGIPLKKACAARVSRDGRTGRLRALLPAAVLERVAASEAQSGPEPFR